MQFIFRQHVLHSSAFCLTFDIELRARETQSLQALRASRLRMLGTGRSSSEGVGRTVPEHVPAQLFSDTSATISDVPLCGHSLLWKDQLCLV